jgi:hypothetical protein
MSAFANESKSKLHQSFLLPCKMLLTMFLHCHCKNIYIYVNTDLSPILKGPILRTNIIKNTTNKTRCQIYTFVGESDSHSAFVVVND